MKRPGDDGYDFPCGDSHTRIDYAYGMKGYSPPGPRFSNNKSGQIYHPTIEAVKKFRAELVEQLEICDLFLREKREGGDAC